MFLKKSLVTIAAASTLAMIGLATTPGTSVQAAAARAKVTGRVSGTPAGTRALAVLANGSSVYAKISGGKFTITLPKVKTSTATFSLHFISAKQSYAGPVSFGKVSGKKTTWYGRVSVKNGATTSLPKITFKTNYGAVKMTGSAAKLKLSVALRGVSSIGKPAGAGKFGLASKRLAKSMGVRAMEATGPSGATGPGDDLDGDGIPNSLDIDDDGDGFPDPVDKSAGEGGSAPTAKYDAFSSLGSGIGNGPNRVTSPINYNFLRERYPSASDLPALMKELSYLDDANFSMNIRAVSPFFTETMGVYIKAAWVDCTGLAWCLKADDQSDPSNFVSAPRMLAFQDDTVWKWAYTKTPGSPCNVHDGSSCENVRWADFSMKDFVQKAIDNGSPNVNKSTLDLVADQGTPGFGLFDAYIQNGPPSSGSKGNNSAGFDLNASINPHGYGKFLDNLKPGDVFTINAILSDGTTSSIAMTVAPYLVTTPAVTSFTPSGGPTIPVDYNSADTHCANHESNDDCRFGSEGKPFDISASDPVLDLTFWRPQRLRIAGADDGIAGGEPFVDIGGLDYRVSVQGGDGSQFIDCPNNAVKFTSSDGATWTEVPKPKDAYSNDREFMKDDAPDAASSTTRTVSLRIDFSKCTGLSTSASSQKYSVRLDAASQPTFGRQRGGASQSFYFKFQ